VTMPTCGSLSILAIAILRHAEKSSRDFSVTFTDFFLEIISSFTALRPVLKAHVQGYARPLRGCKRRIISSSASSSIRHSLESRPCLAIASDQMLARDLGPSRSRYSRDPDDLHAVHQRRNIQRIAV